MNNIINIENRIGKLKLNDSVSKDSADQLIEELEQLYGEDAVASNMKIGDVVCSAQNALESVEVEINSPGGSVFEGQRIYNALKGISSRGVEVTTTVNGLAASMGSVILMAGDTRKMTQGSRIMIHEASTMTWGDADYLKKQSQILESISAEIADIYAERANGSVEEIRQLMKDETWMTATQAEDAGFVDVVIKDGKDKVGKEDATDKLKSEQLLTNKKLMFKSDKELKAKFEASQTEVGELKATIETHKEETITLTEDVKAATDKVTDLEASIVDLTAKNETGKASIEEASKENKKVSGELKDANDKLDKFDEKVDLAAQSKVAELGHNKPLDQSGGKENKVDKSNLHGTARILASYQEKSPIK